MSMLNPPEREKYVIGAVVKGVAKHAKDIFTSPTKGQEIVEKATKGQRATRKAQRKAALASAAGTYGIVKGEEFLSGLSSSAEAKVKENKSGSVTDITSGTMNDAFSKASKNPTKYVFIKQGQPHFMYNGQAVPFTLATEESDVVLDMVPREKKTTGSIMQRNEERMVPGFAPISNTDRKEYFQLQDALQDGSKTPEELSQADRDLIEMVEAVLEAERQEREQKVNRNAKAKGSMLLPPELQEMPVDTYTPEDQANAEATQVADDMMEEEYVDYIINESLDDDEQNYLAEALTNDPRLSDIMDKVFVTASEFTGSGEVEGPGTGVSDSIPARLSDGEFVMTRKATDQIGADNLQRMMDDAERAYDGGLQSMAVGGMVENENPENMSRTDEEIRKLMMGANQMPSLR